MTPRTPLMTLRPGQGAPEPGRYASLHARLRERTAALHGRAEDAIAAEARLTCPAAYRDLLLGFLGLYRPVEAALAGIDWAPTGIDIAARRKSGWLEADLRHLGLSDEAVGTAPACPFVPALDGAAAAIGCLYVVEGASLGGRVLLREVSARLPVGPARGARFFEGYGAETGAMWRACLAALNAVDPGSRAADRAEEAAAGLFEAFARWLAMPETQGSPAIHARSGP